MNDEPLEAPELDYAFLAEFARVEGNSLTAVGASFTHLTAVELPLNSMIYVAGRIRSPRSHGPFPVEISFGPDGSDGQLSLSTTFDPSAAANPYRDRVGITFAVGIPVEIEKAGLQRVEVLVNDLPARALRFDVEADQNNEA